LWTVSDPTPAERAVAGLHEQSERGDGYAQLRLGRTYSQGRDVSKDLIAAYVWTAMAASNGAADPATRGEAAQDLAALTRRMKADELDQARRFVQTPGQAADCAAGPPRGGVPILLVGSGAPQLLTNTAETKASCAASSGPLASFGSPSTAPRATIAAN
jgi:TPR repeat protein